VRIELAGDPDRQGLAGELVDHAQHPKLAAIAGPVLDEVVGPDLIWPLRPQPDAGSIRQPQPVPLGLPGRHLQPLPPPDPLDPLAVDLPAGLAQQRRDTAVAVATIAPRQLDDVRGQGGLIVRASCDLALGRAVLAEHPATVRSDTPSWATTCSTQPRRREGLTSFPTLPP
jgi:hypothetical protein